MSYEEVAGKFRENAEFAKFPQARAEEVVAMVRELESLPKIATLTAALAHDAADARPVVGLMPGDMTGIGPEITAKLLASRALRDVARVAVIGDARVWELGAGSGRAAGLARLCRRGRDRLVARRDPRGGPRNTDPATLPAGRIRPSPAGLPARPCCT
jgi:hypothetical protein